MRAIHKRPGEMFRLLRSTGRDASDLIRNTRRVASRKARQGAGTFTVAPVLDGMWAEAQASGPAMRAGVTGVARAAAGLLASLPGHDLWVFLGSPLFEPQ